MELRKQIASGLKRYLQLAGIKQKTIAEKANVSISNISQILSGRRNFSLDIFEKLMRAAGFSKIEVKIEKNKFIIIFSKEDEN